MNRQALFLFRRGKREEYRKRQEELQQQRLAQADGASYESTEVKPAAQKLNESKKSDDSNRQQERAAAAAPAASFAHATGHAEAAPLPPQEAFFGDRRLPTDVGLPHMKASPSSSVSMSQSPAKPPPRRKTLRYLNDSSSDEEDIVALAKKQQAARPVVKTNDVSDSPDDEPAMKEAKKPTHRGKISSFMDDSDDDDDDDDNWLQALRRQEEVKRNKKSTCEDSDDNNADDDNDGELKVQSKAKTPRNPLVLMKEQEASFRVPVRRRSEEEVDKNLWSDSEEEAAPSPPSSKKKKKNKDVIDAFDEMLANKEKKKTKERLGQNKKRDYEREHVRVSTIPDISDDKLNELKSELKPTFKKPKFGPFDPPQPLKLGFIDDDDEEYEVPMSISRYLPKYQQEGIQFLFNNVAVKNQGAILGDDMGLGKTVQTISFLSALFKKTGNGLDLLELSRRKKLIEARNARRESEKQKALMEGRVPLQADLGVPEKYPSWAPILITAPESIIKNWVEDFETWGHFSIAVCDKKEEREAALQSIQNGMAEVLVCGHSMIQSDDRFRNLLAVNWKIVIVDEFHEFKNYEGHLAVNLRFLRDKLGSLIIGLTGTIMQNHHIELWSLLDCISQDYWGTWKEFNINVAKPIADSRATDADEFAIEQGDIASHKFTKKLNDVFLRRTKDDVLADELPQKDERIVFCEPSPLQKELYRFILDLPDFTLIRECNGPCDCGVNQKFFLEYKHLRSREEQIEYISRNKKKIIKRGECCYQIPRLKDGSGEIDPRAVLWLENHVDQPCGPRPTCPHCINFTALHIVYKLGSHAALLQVKDAPERFGKDSKLRENAEKLLERAKVFFPEHVLSQLPGGYIRNSSMMDEHFSLSGKMRTLDKLLRAISVQQGRVLLFSYSTQMLDLIENYTMSKGYSYLRMDGQTSNARRKELADEFKSNPSIFLFLLSTKAMGLGLNLTAANYVIIFDVDWNPSNDSQAQDRAYRIGQDKNVTVFRLVSRGTVEELRYLRQVYKTQMKNETIVDINDPKRKKSKRTFRGVVDDTARKGELFGMANLLKFKDGTFLNYASKTSESRKYGVGVHDTENLLEQVKDMNEDEVLQIGEEENMFENLANCTETERGEAGEMDYESDEDGSNLGGESQAVMNICERVEVHEDVDMVDSRERNELLEGEPAIRAEGLTDNVCSGKPTLTYQDFAAIESQTQSTPNERTVENANRSNGRMVELFATGQSPQTVKKEAILAMASEASTVKGNDEDQEVGERAQPMAENYPDMETQSPMNIAEPSSQHMNAKSLQNGFRTGSLATVLESQSVKNNLFTNTSVAVAVTTTNEELFVSGDRQAATAEASPKKKASPRNTLVVGKTTDKIRRGEAGGTTFSAFDLSLPGGIRKKKKIK